MHTENNCLIILRLIDMSIINHVFYGRFCLYLNPTPDPAFHHILLRITSAVVYLYLLHLEKKIGMEHLIILLEKGVCLCGTRYRPNLT